MLLALFVLVCFVSAAYPVQGAVAHCASEGIARRRPPPACIQHAAWGAGWRVGQAWHCAGLVEAANKAPVDANARRAAELPLLLTLLL